MSFLKRTDKALEYIKKEKYLSATAILNDKETMTNIDKFLRSPEDSISDDDIKAVKNVLLICKSLYEVNQYMSGVLFKLIPDHIYDSLIERYKYFKEEEPFQNTIPSGMRSTDQDFPELAGTLDKAYEVYDITDKPSVEKWLKKIVKETGEKILGIHIAPKFDGTSLTVTFENRNNEFVPVKATTRGDFENNKGVDLTNILVGRKTKKWSDKAMDDFNIKKIGVQYEAMITEEGRRKLSKIVKTDYSTRRAAIAAALKRISNPNTPKDELKEINKCVCLVPLNVDEKTTNILGEIPWEAMMFIVKDTFSYVDDNLNYSYSFIKSDIDTILNYVQNIVQEYSKSRYTLPYSIDGLVLTVTNKDIREKLGRSNNKNKWQIAYKFDAMVQRTRITGIISTQGKQGYIGHNITFEPIEFNGVVYDKAPVNNITRFKALDPHIGDEVLVSYNADVMGYIYKDETCKPNPNGEPIELPMFCPNCQAPLIVHKDMLKCVNEDCPGNKTGRILEAIRIFGLDYFGEETAADLVEKAGISNAIEFIQMKYEDLAKVLKGLNLEKAWEEFQNKIKSPIEYSKIIDLLRIPGLRTKTARKIIDHIKIENLLKYLASKDKDTLLKEMKKVRGIDKNAKDFTKGLIRKADELFTLIKLLNPKNEDEEDYDKVVLISGFRNNEEFEEICKRLKYKIIETGSKFDLLVATPDRMNGKKAELARKKNIPIVTLSEFIYQNKV